MWSGEVWKSKEKWGIWDTYKWECDLEVFKRWNKERFKVLIRRVDKLKRDLKSGGNSILWMYERVDEMITWNKSIEDKTGHELERKKL